MYAAAVLDGHSRVLLPSAGIRRQCRVYAAVQEGGTLQCRAYTKACRGTSQCTTGHHDLIAFVTFKS